MSNPSSEKIGAYEGVIAAGERRRAEYLDRAAALDVKRLEAIAEFDKCLEDLNALKTRIFHLEFEANSCRNQVDQEDLHVRNVRAELDCLLKWEPFRARIKNPFKNGLEVVSSRL